MKKILLYLISALLFLSCNDVFEKNIKNQSISIITPVDSTIISNYSVLFWWEDNTYILNYRIQIAEPNFINIQQLYLDSVINTTKVIYTLPPGEYTFRIRGENNSGNTQYYYKTFSIDTNYDLTNQPFSVSGPAPDIYTNSIYTSFQWNSFPFATFYTYSLFKSGILQKVLTTNQNKIIDTINNEGKYTWNIFATNSNNNTYTANSIERTITVDFSPPFVSTLIAPLNNALVNNPVTLSWSRNSSDILFDSVYISSFIDFSSIIERTSTTNSTFEFSGISGNTYYWKLLSVDSASNLSDSFSTVRKFIMN